MTKEEMVTRLKDEIGVEESKASLRKKTNEELEEMLKRYEKAEPVAEEVTEENTVVGEGEATEEVVETGEGEVTETPQETGKSENTEDTPEEGTPEEEEEELTSMTTQLNIFKEYVYIAKKKATQSLKVENLGYGDVYVSDEEAVVGKQDQLVVTGQSKVIEGATTIKLMTASQPQVKITELK